MNFLDAHKAMASFGGGEPLPLLLAISGSASQLKLFLDLRAKDVTAALRTGERLYTASLEDCNVSLEQFLRDPAFVRGIDGPLRVGARKIPQGHTGDLSLFDIQVL